MAYKIVNFDGTKAGVSSDYPFNNVKNAPSGTRVNTKMVTDMLQTFQKMMDTAGITPNELPDNVTNGYQVFRAMQVIMNQYAKQIIISMFGVDYDATKVYILSGAATRFVDGYAFYNGEIYFVLGNPGPACGGGLVDVLNLSTTLLQYGVRVLQVGCGASGSGVSDFANVIYFNSWLPTGLVGADFSGVGGGSISVDPADIISSRYKIVGNTCYFETILQSFTITGTVNGINISLPFLPNNVFKVANMMYVCAYDDGGSVYEPVYAFTVNGSPSVLQVTRNTAYPTGAGSGGTLWVSVVFEMAQ